MRYVILLYGDEAAEAALTPDERRGIIDAHLAFSRRARERGIELSGEALEPSTLAITIRGGNVTDGPFAETKEQLGGYYVVDMPDRAAVIELAREIPESPGLTIEIRPLSDI